MRAVVIAALVLAGCGGPPGVRVTQTADGNLVSEEAPRAVPAVAFVPLMVPQQAPQRMQTNCMRMGAYLSCN